MNFSIARKLIQYLRQNHRDEFAKTLKILDAELIKCSRNGITKEMETYANILVNTLTEDRKIVVDSQRAWLVNFTIAGIPA